MAIDTRTGHNDVGFDFFQLIVGEPQPGHDTGGKIFHNDIDFADQFFHDLDTLQVLDIESDAEFACIGLDKQSASVRVAHIVFEGGRHAPYIRMFFRLHFEDLGPEISQKSGYKRTRSSPTEIQYIDAL